MEGVQDVPHPSPLAPQLPRSWLGLDGGDGIGTATHFNLKCSRGSNRESDVNAEPSSPS